MSAVLLLPPIFQFFDNNGDPLEGGKVFTYAAGTTTKQATYTDSTGASAAPNPIQLDAAGRPESGMGAIWGNGAYKFIVQDADGVQIGDPLDNVVSFTTLAAAASPYAQTFSGDGVTTVFTASSNLGTDSKALLAFIDKGLQTYISNGDFGSDTIWTKGAGWTIAAGVATAIGAISTPISQTAIIALLQGQAYDITNTITVSAGNLTASIGGQTGTARTASGTYRETIAAGSSQTIAFTGAGFTGTLDAVSVTPVQSQGFQIQIPSALTVNGTTITFAVAPPIGTGNILVFAPSLLLGAASAAAALAQGYAAAALTSENNAAAAAVAAAGSAASAAAYQAKNRWIFSNAITMTDPGTGKIKFNSATPASITAIAISDLSGDPTNPDLSAWVNTWDDGSGSNRGTIYIFKDTSNFALFAVTGNNIDGGTWNQLAVSFLAGAGSFSNTDPLFIGFAASGATTVTGGITALTGDVIAGGTGSVPSTIANGAVTEAKQTLVDNTTNDVSATKHGYTPKAPGDATKFLNGASTPAYAAVKDSDLSVSDITTNNFTTSAHGFVPKGTNIGNFLKDDGTWSAVGGVPQNTPIGFSAVTTITITTDFTTYTDADFDLFITSTTASPPLLNFAASSNGGSSYPSEIYDGLFSTGTTTVSNAISSINTAANKNVSMSLNQTLTNKDLVVDYLTSSPFSTGKIYTGLSAAGNRFKITSSGGNITGSYIYRPTNKR